MSTRNLPQPGGSPDAAYITNEGVTQRWNDCSTETVRRTARREKWRIYRMGGRVCRYRLSEVIAYEERCANRPPSYSITPPKRHSNPGTAA